MLCFRGDLPHPVPIRPYQWLYVDSKAKDRDTVLFITELLKYRGDTHLGTANILVLITNTYRMSYLTLK